MSNVKDKPNLIETARRLAIARTQAGYKTRADGARALGVNPTTYRAWENAQNGVPQEQVAHICATYAISTDWLLTGGHYAERNAVHAQLQGPSGSRSRKIGGLDAVEMTLDADGLSIRQADDQHGSVGIFVPPDHIPMFMAYLTALVAQGGA